MLPAKIFATRDRCRRVGREAVAKTVREINQPRSQEKRRARPGRDRLPGTAREEPLPAHGYERRIQADEI